MSVGLGMFYMLIKEGRQITALKDLEVHPDMLTEEERKVLIFIEDHVINFQVLPNPETIERETGITFGSFPEEPLGYWADRVRRRAQSMLYADAVKGIREAVSTGDLSEARNITRNLVVDLDDKFAVDKLLTFAGLVPKVMEEHDRRQKSGSMAGIPFGLEYIDQISDGAQGTDTIAIVGRPSVGKSYFLLNMCLSASEAGKVAIFVSLEMNAVQCARRLLALKTGVSTELIRLGQLSYLGRGQIDKAVINLQEPGKAPLYLLQGALGMTVEDVLLRVQELRPDVLYVDGAYLLRIKSKYSGRWEMVTESAERLKTIATEFNIPVLGSYQFNRKGPGSLANIGLSDAIGQLASIVMGIEEEKNKTDEGSWSKRSYKILRLLKGREGESGVLRVLYDMQHMVISQDRVLGDTYEDEYPG